MAGLNPAIHEVVAAPDSLRDFSHGGASQATFAARGKGKEISCTIRGPQGHCGPLGLINRPRAQQISDWRRIGPE
jgi:hypothetical protein